MAVVSVTKKWSGRPVSLSKDQRSYTEGYTVLVDSPENAPILVVSASGLPPDGAALPGDNWARLRRRTAREIGPLAYEVSCIYETAPKSGATPGADPLSEPAKISFTTQRTREQVEVDLDGRVVANTAAILFDPPIEIDVDDPVMIVSKNYPSVDIGVLMAYRNAVNSDEFFGAAPGQAKLDSIEAVRVLETDLLYWTVTFRIVFREGLPAKNQATSGGPLPGYDATVGGPARAWWVRVANTGYDEYVGQDSSGRPKYRKIVGQLGEPVNGPSQLDHEGAKLHPISPTRVLEFRFRQSKPFAALNIL